MSEWLDGKKLASTCSLGSSPVRCQPNTGRSPTLDGATGGSGGVREFVARHDDEFDGLAEPGGTSHEDPSIGNTKLTWYSHAEESETDASSTPADD